MQKYTFEETNGFARGGSGMSANMNVSQNMNRAQPVQPMNMLTPTSVMNMQTGRPQQTNTAVPQQNVQPVPKMPMNQDVQIAPQLAQHTERQHGRRQQAEKWMKDRLWAAENPKTMKEWIRWCLGLQWLGRNVWLLVSAVVGSGWFVFMIIMLSRVLNIDIMSSGYEQAIGELRAGISVFMQMPSIMCGFVGMIFNWLAWAQRKRGFALTAAILYGAAVLLSFGQSLGYGVFMAVNLLGYGQMERETKKRKYAQWQLGIDGSTRK